MINVVKRTGHSSYYVEKGMAAMGKTPKQMGLQGEFRVNGGGEHRPWFTCRMPPLKLMLYRSVPNLA
jgi:hypothetical protein